MRLLLDATPAEVRHRGPELLKALAGRIEHVAPQLAKALEIAADDPSRTDELRWPVLQDLHRAMNAEYQRQLGTMLSEIGKVLDESATRGKTAALEKAHRGMPKAAALYLRFPDTDYQCADCSMWIPKAERCTIHGPDDTIRAEGSCGFFIKGKPHGDKAMGMVTTEQSGYEESKPGFSCKWCQHFVSSPQQGRGDCQRIDKDSKGQDPGNISPEACCNAWEAAESLKMQGERSAD